jgi:hypothetical protein
MIDDERIWGRVSNYLQSVDKSEFAIIRVSDLSNLLVLLANMPVILCVMFVVMPVYSADKFYFCMRNYILCRWMFILVYWVWCVEMGSVGAQLLEHTIS